MYFCTGQTNKKTQYDILQTNKKEKCIFIQDKPMGCSVLITTFNMITHTQKRSWEAEQTMKWIQEQVRNE